MHARQWRKGTGVPYVAHLLAVTALVLEDGGDEDQAIAALLHDAAEDQGGQACLDEIRARFGERVADIVSACTDTLESPKPPWRPRKEAYLVHLREVRVDALRVSLADKLHNLRSIVADLRQTGDALWGRFSAGPGEQVWYFRSILDVHRARGHHSRLVDAFASELAELERLIAA